LSLSVSAYTAYTLHVQTRAQVFPFVQFIDLGEAHRMAVFNKGVGPAFVKSMRVEVAGKPVMDWKAFFKATQVEMHGSFAYSNVNHTAIAANETLPALLFSDEGDFRRYESIDPKIYHIDLCYCSVLDECWTIHAGPDIVSTPESVSMCKVDPASDFTQ
jgi:hypothetical protein